MSGRVSKRKNLLAKVKKRYRAKLKKHNAIRRKHFTLTNRLKNSELGLAMIEAYAEELEYEISRERQ